MESRAPDRRGTDGAAPRRPRRSGTERALTIAAWTTIPLAASLLVALRYRHTWYFYDEWSLASQLLGSHGSLPDLMAGYNGHLYVVPRLVYAAQLFWVGTPNHLLIWAVFCGVLVGWTYSVALLLKQLKVPPVVALLAGVMIVYFGAAAQLVTFEINLSTDGALALALLAAFVALRHAAGGYRPALAVAGLLLLATCFDSGAGTVGIVFVAAMVLLRLPTTELAVAIGPPAVLAGWAAVAEPGPRWPAGLWVEIQFAVKLLLLAAGGLVGSGVTGGIVLLAASAIALAFGYRAGALGGDIGRSLVAGWVAAIATIGVLADTRAGLLRSDFTPYNRYVSEVALFTLIALLPSLWATAVALRPRWRPELAIGAAVAVSLVFVLGLPGLTSGQQLMEGYFASTRDGFPQAVAVAELRCPSGERAPAADAPLGPLDPQLTVGLLRQMRAEGLFTSIAPATPTPAMVQAACQPGDGRS